MLAGTFLAGGNRERNPHLLRASSAETPCAHWGCFLAQRSCTAPCDSATTPASAAWTPSSGRTSSTPASWATCPPTFRTTLPAAVSGPPGRCRAARAGDGREGPVSGRSHSPRATRGSGPGICPLGETCLRQTGTRGSTRIHRSANVLLRYRKTPLSFSCVNLPCIHSRNLKTTVK